MDLMNTRAMRELFQRPTAAPVALPARAVFATGSAPPTQHDFRALDHLESASVCFRGSGD